MLIYINCLNNPQFDHHATLPPFRTTSALRSPSLSYTVLSLCNIATELRLTSPAILRVFSALPPYCPALGSSNKSDQTNAHKNIRLQLYPIAQ